MMNQGSNRKVLGVILDENENPNQFAATTNAASSRTRRSSNACSATTTATPVKPVIAIPKLKKNKVARESPSATAAAAVALSSRDSKSNGDDYDTAISNSLRKKRNSSRSSRSRSNSLSSSSSSSSSSVVSDSNRVISIQADVCSGEETADSVDVTTIVDSMLESIRSSIPSESTTLQKEQIINRLIVSLQNELALPSFSCIEASPSSSSSSTPPSPSDPSSSLSSSSTTKMSANKRKSRRDYDTCGIDNHQNCGSNVKALAVSSENHGGYTGASDYGYDYNNSDNITDKGSMKTEVANSNDYKHYDEFVFASSASPVAATDADDTIPLEDNTLPLEENMSNNNSLILSSASPLNKSTNSDMQDLSLMSNDEVITFKSRAVPHPSIEMIGTSPLLPASAVSMPAERVESPVASAILSPEPETRKSNEEIANLSQCDLYSSNKGSGTINFQNPMPSASSSSSSSIGSSRKMKRLAKDNDNFLGDVEADSIMGSSQTASSTAKTSLTNKRELQMISSKRPVSLNQKKRGRSDAVENTSNPGLSNPETLMELSQASYNPTTQQEEETSTPSHLSFSSSTEDASVLMNTESPEKAISASEAPVVPVDPIESSATPSAVPQMEMATEQKKEEEEFVVLSSRRKSRRQSVSGSVFKASKKASKASSTSTSSVKLSSVSDTFNFLPIVEEDSDGDFVATKGLPVPTIAAVTPITTPVVKAAKTSTNSKQSRGRSATKSKSIDLESAAKSDVTSFTVSCNEVSDEKNTLFSLNRGPGFFLPTSSLEMSTSCASGLTFDLKYVEVVSSLIESSKTFMEWTIEEGLVNPTLRDFISNLNLHNTLSIHMLYLSTAALALVCESTSTTYKCLEPLAESLTKIAYKIYQFECDNSSTSGIKNSTSSVPPPPKMYASSNTSSKKAAKKSVRFSSDVLGACVSPPNERIEDSWKSILLSSQRLEILIREIYNAFEPSSKSKLYSNEALIAFNTVLVELHRNKSIVERSMATIQDNFVVAANRGSSHIPLQHLIEAAELIVPDLSNAVSQCDSSVTIVSLPTTVLKFRLSWSVTSVIRANIRYLFDDTYPIISSGARYNYDKTRCGLFHFIEVFEQALPLFEIGSGVRNVRDKKEVISDDERPIGWLDLPNVCLSTLFAQALRQYHEINEDFVKTAAETFASVDLVTKTELAQRILAAEAGRIFLHGILNLSCSSRQTKVWSIVEEMAGLIGEFGIYDDAHWSLCSDLAGLKSRLPESRSQSYLIKESCVHLMSLEIAGLQHPLAKPTLDKKHRGRRARSFLANIDDVIYDELSILVSNCDLIFDFPVVREVKTMDFSS